MSQADNVTISAELDLRERLQNLFGLDDFRPAQRQVIEDVLGHRDVLCVMPTGAGKSLCYQLPAAIQGGLTLVVSPLISLMEDQVQQLRDEGIAAALLNSSLTASFRRQVMAEVRQGFNGLLYVAPERFYAADFAELMPRLKVRLLVVDEAHCISQWGHDFRKEYARLGEIRRALGSPPAIALTATATEDVRADIIGNLGMADPQVYITGFDRPNLRYESRTIARVKDKDAELIDLLRQETSSGIVYCATRKAVEAVAGLLSEHLPGRPVFAYHAGMDMGSRTANQEQFMQTPRSIAVATNAFGMGINKPDVRWVFHYNLPGTLEAYYQEAGRAGRDGRPARCLILFSYQDKFTQSFFIDKLGEDSPAADPVRLQQRKLHAYEKLERMIQYAQTHRCRRQMILDYFNDQGGVLDCQCDVCTRGRAPVVRDEAAEPMSEQVVTLVRQMLSAIARLRGRFGVGMVAEVLAGAENEKTARWGLSSLTVFGLLRTHTVKRVIAMLHRLMEAGLARQKDPDGVKFRPVIELTPVGIAVMKAEVPPPATLADLLPRRGMVERAAASPSVRVEGEPAVQLDAAAASRFERLRAVRLSLARERQIPTYCICHDSTLKLMAHSLPGDLAALEQIKGMGPQRVRQYGKLFLDALNGA
jgi:ATP-dependent DNA helicase RecQ